MTHRPPCPACDHRHTPHSSTAMVGRFTRAAPMYRALYDGAPLRNTRAEAELDACAHNRAIDAHTD